MTKTLIDSALDALLLEVANFGSQMHLCRLAPISYHEAVNSVTQNTSGVSMGQKTLTLSMGAGTYSAQNGDVSGRKVAVMSQTSITLSETGNVNHLAIVSVTRSALLLVTTVTSQAVTAGNTAATSMFDLEARDPT